MKVWLTEKCTERGQSQSQLENRWGHILIIRWNIWKVRCGMVFENKLPNPLVVENNIRQMVIEFRNIMM